MSRIRNGNGRSSLGLPGQRVSTECHCLGFLGCAPLKGQKWESQRMVAPSSPVLPWARLPGIFSISALLLDASETASPPLIARAFSERAFKGKKKLNQGNCVHWCCTHSGLSLATTIPPIMYTEGILLYSPNTIKTETLSVIYIWSWMVLRYWRANGWDHYLAITLTHCLPSHHTSSAQQPSVFAHVRNNPIQVISTSHLPSIWSISPISSLSLSACGLESSYFVHIIKKPPFFSTSS